MTLRYTTGVQQIYKNDNPCNIKLQILNDKCFDMKHFHKIKNLNLRTTIEDYNLEDMKNLKTLVAEYLEEKTYSNLPSSLESLTIEKSVLKLNYYMYLPQLKHLSTQCDYGISKNSYKYLSSIKDLKLKLKKNQSLSMFEDFDDVYDSEYYNKLVSENKLDISDTDIDDMINKYVE